ncbi:MAG: hypothetical protein KKE73_04965 [Proteobacteria bacterium]|nr:hypothetical protein [Pseudomonadota bacterium]
MANEERSKTLSYLRVTFMTDDDGKKAKHTLAHYLNRAHEKTPNIEDRTFLIDGQEVACCHFKPRKKGGQLLHVAVSTPGEAVSLVPKPKKVKEVDLGTLPPPAGKDFMDGDIMLLVQDNHVLFCSTGVHVKKASEYLRHLFAETEQPDQALAFALVKVADVNKIALIREKGVKRLHMNAGLFTATQTHEERVQRTTQRKLFHSISNELKGLFAKDEALKEYSDAENLTAELIIRFDRRIKGGEIGQRRIESLAEMIVTDEDGEGFKIVTYDDEMISSEAITLRQKIKVPKDGKTVDYKSVWRAMNTYLAELEQKGLLDQ